MCLGSPSDACRGAFITPPLSKLFKKALVKQSLVKQALIKQALAAENGSGSIARDVMRPTRAPMRVSTGR